jgi:hypothetical protein
MATTCVSMFTSCRLVDMHAVSLTHKARMGVRWSRHGIDGHARYQEDGEEISIHASRVPFALYRDCMKIGPQAVAS